MKVILSMLLIVGAVFVAQLGVYFYARWWWLFGRFLPRPSIGSLRSFSILHAEPDPLEEMVYGEAHPSEGEALLKRFKYSLILAGVLLIIGLLAAFFI
jgi:hypothetical protein